MAKRYGNDQITTNDLTGYVPQLLIASGYAWDGKHKRLIATVEFVPTLRVVLNLTQKDEPDREFYSLTSAINAYNEL